MKLLLSGWLFSICLCFSLYAAAEDMTMEIIPLKHRLADDIIPVLRPLLHPGGTITGMNDQLIIKTTPENLAQIRSVLDRLDRSPRRLLIQVKQGVIADSREQEHALSGRVTSGDVTVGINDTTGRRNGVVISGRDGDGNVIRYRGGDSHVRSDEGNSFTVQATEGYPAYIAIGQSIPVSNRSAFVPPGGGVVVNDTIEYINADSGFYVLPRLNGDQVTLLVAPRLTRVAPGRAPILDVQDVETTATGRLGEWMELGGIDRQSSQDNQGIASSSQRSSTESRPVLIRVDEIK